MKISQKGPFQKGYNAIVKEEVNKDMGMDFGVLCMDQGDVVEYNEPKEVVYTLTNGVITFEFAGKKETADRPDCFHNDPILLHVPENTPVKITCLSDHAELSIQRTTNKRHFAPKLYRAADCLCPSEERGKGTLGEASTRIVRTFFDRSTCPETNFFIGEVVFVLLYFVIRSLLSRRSTSTNSCLRMVMASASLEMKLIRLNTMI